MLLTAGLIKESNLYSALRCQSLLKLGHMSASQAVQALEHSFKNGVTLDESMATWVQRPITHAMVLGLRRQRAHYVTYSLRLGPELSPRRLALEHR